MQGGLCLEMESGFKLGLGVHLEMRLEERGRGI